MQYFIGIESKSLTETDAASLKDPRVSGVVLYSHNIGDETQLKKLTSGIKSTKNSLEIAVDEEGGQVSRIGHLIESPSQLSMAKLDYNSARQAFQRKADRLRDLGLTLNFAPVVDLAPNST